MVDESSVQLTCKVKKINKRMITEKDLSMLMNIIISSHLLQDNRKENSPIQFDSDALTLGTLTSAGPFDLCSDLTGHRANQRNAELQQLADHASDSSTGEEDEDEEVQEEEEALEGVEEEVGRDCRDVRMGGERRESQDRVEEDEQSWGMEADGRRAVDEEEDEEAVKDRLCRLVAHARLTYFTSTDDELDKAGLSEGECEEGKDEERRDDKTHNLSYTICQLEKEVRVSQFSSTEDELDRVGVEEEELAVKVCKLAHQVKATQFSSTEEELDGAGGGEETDEEEEEESLWTFQKENAARAAHLSSLVRTARFSSTEDQQEDGNEDGEVQAQPGTPWERRESLGDLDVNMFDLRQEIESSGEKERWGNSLDSQRPDEKEGEEEKSDRGEAEDEKQMEREPLVVKETEESLERREGGEERREESDAEEFDRIINGMLLMTLEDMQGGRVNQDAPEDEKTNRELDEKVTEGRESGCEGWRAESGVAETITDGAEEKQSARGEAMRSRREDAAVVTVQEDDHDGTEGRLEEKEAADKRAEEPKEEKDAVVEDSCTSAPEGPLTSQEAQMVSRSKRIAE